MRRITRGAVVLSLRARCLRSSRSFFRWSQKLESSASTSSSGTKATSDVTLAQDNLFHPLSKSPFAGLRKRGETVQSLATCPTCLLQKGERHTVRYECPDCGWATHCTEAHWHEDHEHAKYCSRLRQANEDEHDIRSGRRITEFEMPGPQPYEDAVSFANWDMFWYTRGFASMDTDRQRRHASKLLTYPVTVSAALHQSSGLTTRNQRLTPEGSRSLAALRMTLHVPPGAPDTPAVASTKPPVRIFIVGSRAESALPPHLWEQICHVFPSVVVQVYFVGPQAALPKPATPRKETNNTSEKLSPDTGSPHASRSTSPQDKNSPSYAPVLYEPNSPTLVKSYDHMRTSIDVYGVPSYTQPHSSQLTLVGLRAPYQDIHAQFAETYDPYTDVFVMYNPGLGFPSPTNPGMTQAQSPQEWGQVLPLLLQTRCLILITGFSPTDVERDVRSLDDVPGVTGEFDWLITPGQNAFGSEKWEVADFDPRVMVKTNWGIWGIRGKRRDVVEERYESP